MKPHIDISNHPVHFLLNNKDKMKVSPTAFIPFCEFGGNMSLVGIQYWDFFFCDSFQAKILYDQLCYEVDLNKFLDKNNMENQLKTGFVFIMDYNEDRQITFLDNDSTVWDHHLASRIIQKDNNQHAFIYLDTIGNHNAKCGVSSS